MDVHDIVILGFEQHADAVRGLTRVFGIDEPTARSIVARVPIVVRRNVTEDQARVYEKALLAIGARVQLRAAESTFDHGGAPSQPASQAPPPPSTGAKTLADGVPRPRRGARVETELMHGGGWQFGDVAPATEAPSWTAPSSLPPPAQVAASLPPPAQVAASLPPPAPDASNSFDAPDVRARTTRFAADLVLPWVGNEPEPARPVMQPSRGPK